MKKVIVLLAILTICSTARAQPSKDLARRIEETAALFSSSPGGYDTLFSQDFLNQVPASQLTGLYADYFKKYGNVAHWAYLDSSKELSAKVRLYFSKAFTVDEHISILQNGNHLIEGLLLGPATPQIKT